MARLQKVLATLGFGSRRAIEQWIREGRIVINNSTAQLGAIVNPNDIIYLDGKKVATGELEQGFTKVLLYHKPVGEICTRSDDADRPTVFDNLPPLAYGKWLNVGRLDKNTSGLLIFTNDGELANKIMHPRYGMEREYHVRIRGNIAEHYIKTMQQGLVIDGVQYRFKAVKYLYGSLNNSWYKLILQEGKNREIRKVLHHFGLVISRIVRVRFGDYTLPEELSPGDYMILS